jgi:ABC-type amino acid transport substrate-binding protein
MGVYSKEIRVGVISGAPPFSSSYSTSKGIFFYGFSIDVMNAICNRIDVNCVYKTLSLTNQFQSLKEGSIDVLLLANPYEPEKLKQYAISLPYFISKVQFYANKNSTMNQLALVNLKIGVIATTFYNLLNQSPYREGNQIIPFTSIMECITSRRLVKNLILAKVMELLQRAIKNN